MPKPLSMLQRIIFKPAKVHNYGSWAPPSVVELLFMYIISIQMMFVISRSLKFPFSIHPPQFSLVILENTFASYLAMAQRSAHKKLKQLLSILVPNAYPNLKRIHSVNTPTVFIGGMPPPFSHFHTTSDFSRRQRRTGAPRRYAIPLRCISCS